jgi:hypothetical protein
MSHEQFDDGFEVCWECFDEDSNTYPINVIDEKGNVVEIFVCSTCYRDKEKLFNLD